MAFRCVFLLWFFVLSSMAYATQQPPQSATLCTQGETAVFSCTMGKKLLSVCASDDLSKSAGYLQYRFGRAGQIELQYPTERLHPLRLFSLSFAGGSAKSSLKRLQFFNAEHRYIISAYSSSADDWAYGVEITAPDGNSRYLSCAGVPVANENLHRLQNLGLPDISEPPRSHVR